MRDAITWFDALGAQFSAAADPAVAEGQAAYMKHRFRFFGIKATERRQIQQAFFRQAGLPAVQDWPEWMYEAYAREEREYHYAANELTARLLRKLPETAIDTLHMMIVSHSWWDSVDFIAADLVGPLLMRYPGLARMMDEWIEDDNIWLARTALLHQLRYKDKTDAPRLFSYCEKRAGDTEFFIRKAIGWALRQYAYTAPEAVYSFVDAHPGLSGLSRREALKHRKG